MEIQFKTAKYNLLTIKLCDFCQYETTKLWQEYSKEEFKPATLESNLAIYGKVE